MSWDITLVDDRGHVEFDQNYTHNVNRMIKSAMEAAGWPLVRSARWQAWMDERGAADREPSWWEVLDGLPGPEGARLMQAVLDEFAAHPDTYIAMNPSNGWGSYDGIVEVLERAVASVPEWPCTWEATG